MSALQREEARFEFGRNWQNFLRVLDDERLSEAERSLLQMLGTSSLHRKTFLDIGCGSGLFSLCARRIGATVTSFDYDQASVGCARYLKERFFPKDASWQIEQGSVLDKDYMTKIGAFDVVYSWGVLHHTGQMWNAIENACRAVKPEGSLYISIYNDQGTTSIRWRGVKRVYNMLPGFLRLPYVVCVAAPFELRALISAFIRLAPSRYIDTWRKYKSARGMSRWHDWVECVGGYPFEVAKPEEIIHFIQSRGYTLKRLKTCGGGLGCNEFLFARA
jgi:2-polyprenyl-3-methyl-5-hydroxy-6-metoxy-1,4-benzoquinol methylase